MSGPVLDNDGVARWGHGGKSLDLSSGEDLEAVDHPSHYGGADNPYEAIKVIEAMGWGREFCLGNALKYTMRAGKKGDEAEDLRKAAWYATRAAELAEAAKEADGG